MATTATLPKLITVKEAASLLSLSPKTISNWCASRSIVHVRVKGSVRLRLDTIAELIEKGTTTEREI